MPAGTADKMIEIIVLMHIIHMRTISSSSLNKGHEHQGHEATRATRDQIYDSKN
jgi:hypothetical protein